MKAMHRRLRATPACDRCEAEARTWWCCGTPVGEPSFTGCDHEDGERLCDACRAKATPPTVTLADMFIVASWSPYPAVVNIARVRFQSLAAARDYAGSLPSDREWTIQRIVMRVL